MKNFLARLLLLGCIFLPVAAPAQSTGRVVADCTTGVPLAYGIGSTSLMTMLADGRGCVNAAVSASITGFPTLQSTGTPISVTTGGVTGTLPTGAVVVASNVGATNGAYCKLGASATTSDQLIPPNSWFAFTVGAATQLTCITSTSTTTVNMVGGSGLPTGSGGGGGGSGGGAVTVADGANVVEGAVADAAATTGSTGTFSAKFRLMTTQLNTINTTLGSPFQAGGSLAANQSVNVSQINAVTPLMGNGTTGTGSQRVTIASDNTAFSVNATVSQATSSNLKGQVDPLTAASWGIATSTQNSAVATNGQLALAQFNTAPTTITNTNMSPLQLDNAGNLLVNIKAGAGSGGTALADGATFTEATTNFTPVGGEYVSGGGANCTTGKGCTAQMTIDRAMYINTYKWAGGVLGAMANYGTSPGAVLAPGVNAFVTNTNANGSATSANSSPVVIASDQAAVAVKAASGAIASGAIAAGAQVDLLTMRGTVAAGTAATNSILAGAVFNSTAPTLTTGQQAAVQVSARGGLLLANGYPAGSTPITISATGTTAATTATLATGASVTTYLCSFSIRANATAAATGNATVTGTITGTMNFTQWTAPTASGLGVIEQVYNPCIPASAVNTGIAIISAAPGTGGVVSVTATGYTL